PALLRRLHRREAAYRPRLAGLPADDHAGRAAAAADLRAGPARLCARLRFAVCRLSGPDIPIQPWCRSRRNAPMIAIVDYDIGNLAAVSNMLRRIGFDSVITADPDTIAAADKLILPGNGHFDTCMRNIRATGLVPL